MTLGGDGRRWIDGLDGAIEGRGAAHGGIGTCQGQWLQVRSDVNCSWQGATQILSHLLPSPAGRPEQRPSEGSHKYTEY